MSTYDEVNAHLKYIQVLEVEIERLKEDLSAAEASDEAAHAKYESLITCDNPKCEGKTCGCSYDDPYTICMCHSPRLKKAAARVQKLEEALAWITNVCCGIGRNGETPSVEEWRVAIEHAKAVLEAAARGDEG